MTVTFKSTGQDKHQFRVYEMETTNRFTGEQGLFCYDVQKVSESYFNITPEMAKFISALRDAELKEMN